MDQKINVTLTADSKNAEKAMERSTESIRNMEAAFDDAASAISDANKNITESTETATDRLSASVKAQSQAMEKASAKAKAATETAQNSVSSFGESLKKYVSNFFSIESMVGLGKKIAGAWWKATGAMADIGKKAKALGTSTEYVQKLESTCKDVGVSLSSVEDAFQNVGKQAKKAMAGDQNAIEAFQKLGLSVSRLRTMSPERIFEATTSALDAMGNSAEAQEAKMLLLGSSAEELSDSLSALSKASGNTDGIIKDEDIKNAESLRDGVDKLHASLERLANSPSANRISGWFVNRLNESVEELNYRLNGLPESTQKEWNEVNVSEENKKKARSYDEIEIFRQWRAMYGDATELWEIKKNRPEEFEAIYKNAFSDETNPIIYIPKDENGLTPGQARYAYDAETNPEGFKPAGSYAVPTKQEKATASAKTKRNQVEEIRRLPFASSSEEISAIVSAFEEEIGKLERMEIDRITRDYLKEAKEISQRLQKEADVKALIDEINEELKTEDQKRREKDTKRINELMARAGDDPEAKAKVEELSKKLEADRAAAEASDPYSAACRDLDSARKTYENARRRLEMADKHVLAMQEAAKEERDAARLAKKDATLSKASAKLANFGFSLKKQSKMEKLDASIAAKLSARESGENAIFTTSELRRIKARRKAEKELESAEKALAREKKRQDREAKAAKESEAIAAKQEQMASRNAYFQSAQAVSMATQRSHSLLERIAKASEKSVFVVKQK